GQGSSPRGRVAMARALGGVQCFLRGERAGVDHPVDVASDSQSGGTRPGAGGGARWTCGWVLELGAARKHLGGGSDLLSGGFVRRPWRARPWSRTPAIAGSGGTGPPERLAEVVLAHSRQQRDGAAAV